MTQKKIDDLFSQASSSSSIRSSKRSRVTQVAPNDRDEFDDLFESTSSTKRRRTNNNNNNIKQSTDVFDFDVPSTSTNNLKKNENEKSSNSLKKKRSFVIDDDDESKVIDELFNNDTRKKARRPIKQEESTDVLDMFKTKINTNIPQIISTNDDFKIPINPKISTTQKKIKMFFDDTDLTLLREQTNEQNDIKEYVYVKPVVITGGQWLSKEDETKSTCGTIEPSDNPTIDNNIPDDQRNLMHIQYASLIVDDQIDNSNKSKRNSLTKKSSANSSKKILDGKSFQKQLVLSESTIVRKENLQSCYNALLEDINKPRVPITSSNKQKKSFTSKSLSNEEIIISDDEHMDNVDFFDLSSRKKKF
ncbi:unnamed protein product [Adineta steineri]|uniref:Uncharacterized protein n=1 Tax=Adineta steineri TaxID=433720 RepID=A0A814X0D6_9BILA|nr:unnamed protein product [Adineta steineri]